MYTNSKLAKSIRMALAVGAASTAVLAPATAVAQDSAGVEKISVTGSRIQRTDLEGATPVISISAADIKMEGDFSVADALRSSSLNSFGSFSERSGSSAQSQATINLRGAGSQRTLVLLNGRRFPGSPTLGGASANLNAIPFAAVERIDIMTEGGSSVYGSDAMAGVVNVILKDNYEGLTFSGGLGHRDNDEGTTSKEFSIVGGVSNDKGNITFAFDHQERKGISDGARDYTKASMTDFNGDGEIQAYTETSGWSIYGATIANADFSMTQASPLCGDLISQYGADTFANVAADDDWSEGSTYCMYAFANVSYNTASVDRNTLYVNANYEIAEDVEWFGQAMFVQNSSFGRYAPPAAPWDGIPADNAHNPFDVESPRGYFRWVGIGTRDGNVDDYNQDYTTGLRGNLDWNDAAWEVYYHTNIADNKSIGEYYLSYGGLAYNDANDIDLGSEEGIANMKATTLQNSSSTLDQYFAGIGFDMFELGGGMVSHYFGAEYFEQTYADIYDGQSETGLIGGSAGNSAEGMRDVTAFFFESRLPFTDDLEVNIAVRYDDYSDFGDNVSPAVKARWEVADGVVLRASYSESFRAPGLDELNAATTFSAEGAIDYATGATSEKQYDTYYKSNTNLGAESSDYTNFGVVWDVTDEFGVKLDYFKLSIDNVIQTKTVQALLSDEAAGVITAVAPGTDVSNETFYLIRSTAGTLLEAGTGYFNGQGFEIEGIDLSFNAMFETEFGDFRLANTNSFVLSYDEEVGGVIVDTASWSGQPEFKSVATLSWALADHSVAWNLTYTDSTSENEIFTNGAWVQSGKLDDWLIHNVTYTYNAGKYGAVTLTVNNLTDEDPVLNSAGQWTDQDLYNNFGRDYRVNYTISF
ncbi:TonB-dependent receptor domain-containing protein [Aliiglaciecola lipolytica]|uniref:Iron complex outermembrane recepter protein n=1 Tax=Aliiglaciecola lipolytica E3 TaxID=1127673 RepID=K6YRY5_9ALTE|nr:TonB-dependent receptor [Aliiglaciecola lipolytica]GAC14075.1 iron complex outermembrane recepter protein [Aliiglaciecola lipolytica E3]